MKLVQRLFMGLGALAAAAAVLTTVSPKAHAVVATLVEVANTRSTPVPNQDVDIPARHPYQQTCTSVFAVCDLPFVPPNTELVIQTVSVLMNGGAVMDGALLTVGGGVQVATYLPLVPVGGGQFAAVQQITQYADPGTQPICNTNSGVNFFTCAIVGYTVSLP